MSEPSSSATVSELRDMQARYPSRCLGLRATNWYIRDTGGIGPALIFLPGGLGTADVFYRQVLDLAPTIRCITVDYPNTGVEGMAEGLGRLLDALSLERAYLLGSSLAGYWLQIFGAWYPERVDAMMLANSFCDSIELKKHPLFSVPMLSAVDSEVLKAKWLERLRARERDELRDIQITLLEEGQAGESLRWRLLTAATVPSAPTMKRGRFPIFILDCEDDPILPSSTRAALIERYPQASRVSLSSGGHYPCLTQTAAYTQFIRSALPVH